MVIVVMHALCRYKRHCGSGTVSAFVISSRGAGRPAPGSARRCATTRSNSSSVSSRRTLPGTPATSDGAGLRSPPARRCPAATSEPAPIDRAVQHGRVHPDQAVVLDGAAVHDGGVADADARPDRAGKPKSVCTTTLSCRLLPAPSSDAVHVRPDHGAEEDTRVGSSMVAWPMTVAVGRASGGVDGRRDIAERQDQGAHARHLRGAAAGRCPSPSRAAPGCRRRASRMLLDHLGQPAGDQCLVRESELGAPVDLQVRMLGRPARRRPGRRPASPPRRRGRGELLDQPAPGGEVDRAGRSGSGRSGAGRPAAARC